MKIAFRVDSSYRIGSGHLVRCLTLADRLKQESAEILFICRVHEGEMSQIVRDRGYDVDLLPTTINETKPDATHAHSDWLSVSQAQDASDTYDRLKSFGPVDWLIVDHYAIDASWEKQMRAVAGNIMVIDDLADRPHECEILLDQNLVRSNDNRYSNLVGDECRLLCGPKYALLRPQFLKSKYQDRERDGRVRRILVFFGSVDATGETLKTCHAIASLNHQSIRADVIASPSNPQQKQIREFCNQQTQLNYYEYVDDMAELMASADLAIGAGGTTTWERCALGLPSLVISVAANQIPIASEVERLGIGKYLGRAEEVTIPLIIDAIEQYLTNPEMLFLMSKNALELVDGRGVERVSRIILETEQVGSRTI